MCVCVVGVRDGGDTLSGSGMPFLVQPSIGASAIAREIFTCFCVLRGERCHVAACAPAPLAADSTFTVKPAILFLACTVGLMAASRPALH